MRVYFRNTYPSQQCIMKCTVGVYLCGFLATFIILAISSHKGDEPERWEIYRYSKENELKFYDGFHYPLDIHMAELALRRLSNETSNISIINPHPFRYLQNPLFLCSKQREHRPLQLMILVKSAVQYYQLRVVIRSTWGKKIRKDVQDIQYAFLLGYVPDLQYIVDIEQHIYNDIIQENFDDTYRNNTYKTIMGFNWIVQYCNQAQYVLLLDDDMFLNVDMLKDYLNDVRRLKTRNVFTGIFSHESPPLRDIVSRHFVSLSEYPYDVYPDYLAGSCILTSIDVVKMFQSVFPYVKYLPIDDAYLGIVAKKLNIMPNENIMVENQFSTGIGNISHLIALHGFRDYKFYLSTYSKINR